jgi:DNA-binding response OmpR family regulator
LLENVKKKYLKPPPVVMMITAYGDEENYRIARELGADDFLTKPVDFSSLKEKLNLNS